MSDWYFTPDTYDGVSRMAGPEQNHKGVPDFWRFYRQLPVGYHVLITGGSATAFPGVQGVTTEELDDADSGSGEGGKAWFRGGQTYRITGAEYDDIAAAGAYTEGTYVQGTDGGRIEEGVPWTTSKNLLEIGGGE